MRICYFGDYDPEYSRTKVLMGGLQKSGVTIIHCNVREKGLRKYFLLWKKFFALKDEFDLIFIPMSNSRSLSFLARLFSTKPVVWEPLFSLYDNWVFDRKLVRPNTLKAQYYRFLDWFGCTFADFIILDTNTNVEYFTHTFDISRKKLGRVLVGADTEIFYPREYTKTSPTFEVEFHGGFIPVQGTDVIVRAAHVLSDIDVHFTMIGSGQSLASTKKLAEDLGVKNVTFLPFLPKLEVVEYVKQADVCIGIIGDVPRVVRAIPNKFYEAAAMARPTINADTVALREVFTPGVDTLGMKQGDHEDLARIIRELAESGKAREIGQAAYERFLSCATPEKVAESFLQLMSERLDLK